MATHSSILAGKIPWTEEPGYRPWGLQLDTTERLSTSTHTHTPLDYFIQRPQNTHFFPKLTWSRHQYLPRFALKIHLAKF